MLDKIVLSQDRKEARVYFDTHSVGFYHSEGQVMLLVWEIVFEPSIRLENLAKEREARFLASLENTVEIEIQLSFKEVA